MKTKPKSPASLLEALDVLMDVHDRTLLNRTGRSSLSSFSSEIGLQTSTERTRARYHRKQFQLRDASALILTLCHQLWAPVMEEAHLDAEITNMSNRLALVYSQLSLTEYITRIDIALRPGSHSGPAFQYDILKDLTEQRGYLKVVLGVDDIATDDDEYELRVYEKRSFSPGKAYTELAITQVAETLESTAHKRWVGIHTKPYEWREKSLDFTHFSRKEVVDQLVDNLTSDGGRVAMRRGFRLFYATTTPYSKGAKVRTIQPLVVNP